jgi:hypothetical protein
MDVEKQPTKATFQPKELDPSRQFSGWRLRERKSRPRLCKTIVRCVGFLIIFLIVKALTNTNIESRTWRIPLKWPKFPHPHRRLTPSEREEFFLYGSTSASRLHLTECHFPALSRPRRVL